MYFKKALLILHCFLLVAITRAQDAYKVKYLGSSQGLSNNSVRCIYQDHKGFIWFGTYDGLNRFDGSEFKIYRNRISDSLSLPHNYISALNEDDNRNLWVGTGLGAVCLNVYTNVFSPVFYQSRETGKKEKVSGYVNVIEKDPRGNMLLGTFGQGLIVKPKGSAIAYKVDPPQKDGSRSLYSGVQGICVDRKQRTWVFIADLGLYLFNYKAQELEPVNFLLGNFNVNKLVADEEDNLWIATSVGLLKYSIRDQKVVAHYTVSNSKLSASYVTSLTLDNKNKLWIGTDGGGLDILEINTGQIKSVNEGLSSKSILAIFFDKESRKWIGTNKGGVNIFDITQNAFTLVRREPPYLDLSSNFITSFYEDRNNNLWVGTEGGGLNIWNRKTNSFQHYKVPVISNNTISSIAEDGEGNVWIATFGGGVNRISPNGRVEQYKLINPADGFENKIAICVYCDSQKNLWVTTYEKGHLYLFNKALNKFETFDDQLGDLMSIQEDRELNLWAGGAHYLIRIDRKNKKHQYFGIGKTIRAIHESKNGEFWVGSEGGGLLLLDKRTGKIIKRYSEENGLSSNTIMNILEDASGNLWISTSNGLNKFDIRNRKFTSFYESDGLQGKQFSYRAALRLRSGELAFGGNNGFNIFYPQKVTSRTYFPKVVVTSLKVDNRETLIHYKYKLDTAGALQSITIPFNQAILSIQFAALEFSAPNKIQYKYYLEGWDKDWNLAGASRMVTYNNIREGKYQLRLKSTNAAGIWNDKETIIQIQVLPPWYRSWWAYLLYAIAITGAAYLFLKYRANQEKIKYELKLSKITAEMRKAELESERKEKEMQLQKAQAEYEKEKAERETERVINEKEKEINQKRLSFFTNISHEFRTPLTMIINPVQDLLNKHTGTEKEELRVIKSNAARLLNLADQLLLFRKIEEGAEKMIVSEFDFSNLCSNVFYYFKYEAKTKNINFSLEGVEKPILVYGDKDKIEIILYNLIANAFKYTPREGSIAVKVTPEEKKLVVTIEDTGAGIPEGTGNAIFERFYQAQGHIKLGLGIGLYMVKQFTDMHKGSITYTSKIGEGTKFKLCILMGKEHFGETEIIDRQPDERPGLISYEEHEEAQDLNNEIIIPDKVPVITDKKTILVVDDDNEMRSYIASVLEDEYLIYKAQDGAEGLKIVLEKKPDLIISDVSMPGMDGIELCRAIKLDVSSNHLPVILLTAHTSEEIELEGTEQGADYYITKPFNKEILRARVATLFKSRTNLQRYFYDQVTLKNDISARENVSPEYQDLLNRCIEIVEKHLDDTSFNIEMLAREIGMSYSGLYKRIKLISGQSVNSFIRYLRLRKAAELLITTNDSVKEIAYAVGFNDVKYFREHFIKLFNMKPTEYIRLYRGKMVGTLRVDDSKSGGNKA